jgi:hypothetical protein
MILLGLRICVPNENVKLIHPHPPVGTFSRRREKDRTHKRKCLMKKAPWVLDAILLPLAGEGADRRMRVDQYNTFINK